MYNMNRLPCACGSVLHDLFCLLLLSVWRVRFWCELQPTAPDMVNFEETGIEGIDLLSLYPCI